MSSPLFKRGFRFGEQGRSLDELEPELRETDARKKTWQKGYAAGRRKAGLDAPQPDAASQFSKPLDESASPVGKGADAAPGHADGTERPQATAPDAASAGESSPPASDAAVGAAQEDAASMGPREEARHAIHAARLPMDDADFGAGVCVEHASMGRPCSVVGKDGRPCDGRDYPGIPRPTADGLARDAFGIASSTLNAFLETSLEATQDEILGLGAGLQASSKRWGIPTANGAGLLLAFFGVSAFVGRCVVEVRKGHPAPRPRPSPAMVRTESVAEYVEDTPEPAPTTTEPTTHEGNGQKPPPPAREILDPL